MPSSNGRASEQEARREKIVSVRLLPNLRDGAHAKPRTFFIGADHTVEKMQKAILRTFPLQNESACACSHAAAFLRVVSGGKETPILARAEMGAIAEAHGTRADDGIFALELRCDFEADTSFCVVSWSQPRE